MGLFGKRGWEISIVGGLIILLVLFVIMIIAYGILRGDMVGAIQSIINRFTFRSG